MLIYTAKLEDKGLCKNYHVFETLKHFIFECPAYNTERQKLYNNIGKYANEDTFNQFISDWDYGLYILLGTMTTISINSSYSS